ncbi:MAG: DUF922 domain-containing protein [Nitrospirae bacterium]|nr:DUF922 domain-containing protein [Nitrospirota bacterium]
MNRPVKILLKSAVLVLLATMAFPSMAAAETYQFYDRDGTMIVTNRKSDLPESGPVKVLSSYNRPTGKASAPPPDPTVTVVGRASHARPVAPAPEPLVELVKFTYYDVCGKTADEALSKTLQQGPYDSGEGRRYPGQTKWTMGWGYRLTYDARHEVSAGKVRVLADVHDVDVFSDVEVTLPRLAPGCRLPDNERSEWDRVIGVLRNHEMDHVSLVLDHGSLEAMANGIAGAREYVMNATGNLDAEVRKAVERDTHNAGAPWLKRIRELNDEYDRITDHGIRNEQRDAFFDSL